MWRKTLFVGLAGLLLSGCSLPFAPKVSEAGSVWKSQDGGKVFEAKVKISDTENMENVDVLSLAFHPTDSNTFYAGTLENGIFKTIDGAEHWEKINYVPTKVYGLVIDPSNGDRLYATGTYQETGKIYRSDDAGVNWKEVYSEPGPKTVITSLGISPDNPGTLLAGTSAGVVIQTKDGGMTWKNVYAAKGAVTQIVFEKGLPGMRTFLVFHQGTVTSNDEGAHWQDNTGTLANYAAPVSTTVIPQNLTVLVNDPKSGTFYGGGSNGLFRSQDRGKTWLEVNIIESSKKLPIRAVAVNPVNSNEIVYGSGAVFYKSIDGGTNWSTTDLDISRGMSTIAYRPDQPSTIYFVLRAY